MTDTYNIYEAKTQLSALVERASAGDEIVIAKAGKKMCRMVPYTQARPRRVPGMLKGKVWYSKDCWDPMSDKELKDWYGDIFPPVKSKNKLHNSKKK